LTSQHAKNVVDNLSTTKLNQLIIPALVQVIVTGNVNHQLDPATECTHKCTLTTEGHVTHTNSQCKPNAATIFYILSCNHVCERMQLVMWDIAEQPRTRTASRMLKMERQTERESDGVSECMPSKCKRLAATSPSVL